jgi:hypothetical protein
MTKEESNFGDNDLDYTVDNSVPCCSICNMSKKKRPLMNGFNG